MNDPLLQDKMNRDIVTSLELLKGSQDILFEHIKKQGKLIDELSADIKALQKNVRLLFSHPGNRTTE